MGWIVVGFHSPLCNCSFSGGDSTWVFSHEWDAFGHKEESKLYTKETAESDINFFKKENADKTCITWLVIEV